MSHTFSQIIKMLEDSIDKLQQDLMPIDAQVKHENDGIFITYEYNHQNPQLIVFSPLKYKAYIPKKYDGWEVKFVEWNGEDIQISTDKFISFK